MIVLFHERIPMLNYHHLRYFWAVARHGSLTEAAQRLHVSQSALSVQIRKLEEALGHALFEREGRGLRLTEAGRMVLDHADTIFEAGRDLVADLQGQPRESRQVLRVGALTTLSRNFQIDLLRPLLIMEGVEVVVRSGTMRELLGLLEAHRLDLVLTNRAVPRDAETRWQSRLLQEQPVSLVAAPGVAPRPFRYPDGLDGQAMILPTLDSDYRQDFDAMMQRAGLRPVIRAEVDDMAMLRLMAREGGAIALVPPIVVQDELRAGILEELIRVPDLREAFHAITASRRFPNPLLAEVMG